MKERMCNSSNSENWRDRRDSASGAGGALGLFPEPDDDLPELLSQLGLGKYIDTFQEQEIDFQTFLTLSDEDLKEVGVLTFGARRKMLLAITDLQRARYRIFGGRGQWETPTNCGRGYSGTEQPLVIGSCQPLGSRTSHYIYYMLWVHFNMHTSVLNLCLWPFFPLAA
ncbi:protein bicaudal C homolog 1-like [Engraulis encrasicolus]|uniref:protein bicaudal C homolog 1-like n=1 Tax=Engraulis encrasicolus TaxID=184585 RepID=UPI002FD1ED19